MAELIGEATGLLPLATFAFQSSVTLHSTIQSFQSRLKRVRDLIEELESLSGVLAPLRETVSATTEVDISPLKIPLQHCGNACKEFKQELLRCSSRSGGSRISFRDWADLRYMGEDIDGFRRLLAGYKLTFNVALADVNLRKYPATAESLQSFKDLIETATADVEAHLEDIDERLEIIREQSVIVPDLDAAERRLIKEEQLSAKTYLQIYGQLSSHINQIQLTPQRSGNSPEMMNPDAFSDRVANVGVQEGKNRMADPINLGSDLLTLAVFAFQSSKTLYQAFKSFQKKGRTVREFKEELTGLSEVLHSLQETIEQGDTRLSTLKLPLLSCGKACKELAALVAKNTAHSNVSTRLSYMGKDIDGIKSLMAGYKSTFSIALSNTKTRTALVTADLLKEYEDILKNTAVDLEELINGIVKRIERRTSQARRNCATDETLNEHAPDNQTITEELESIKQCLAICTQEMKQATQGRMIVFKDVKIGDGGTQIVGTTTGDFITAERAMDKGICYLGDISDETLQQLKIPAVGNVSADRLTSTSHLVEVTEGIAIKGIQIREVDSGYCSFDESEQTIRGTTDSESGSVHLIRLQSPENVSGVATANFGNREPRLSRKIVDLDETQRVTPNNEDIGSRKATVQIPEVLTAEKHLEACLSGNHEVLTILRQIFKDNKVDDFREDIRELLKYYHLDLKAEARTNLENASANLLRGHWYRERIAKRIARRVMGQAEEDLDEEEEEKSRTTEKSLFDLDQWLRNNQGFSDPNESDGPPLEDIVISGHTSDDDQWESDSELDQAFKELDYVKSMEHFIFEGTSFQKLLERIQMQAITPRYYALRRILMTLPTEDIEFHFNVQQTWFDRLRCGIERRSTVKWNWWPLHEPQKRLECEQCRISWYCHCGRKHQTDLPKVDATKFEKLIDLRCYPLPKDHLCFGRRRGRRSWRQFLQLISLDSSSATLETKGGSASLAQDQSVSGKPSFTTASGQACGHYSTTPSGPSSQDTPSEFPNNSTSNTNQLSNLRPAHTVHVGQGDDLRLVLGVKGKRRCLDIDQIDLNRQANMVDGELISELMTAHNITRGWLRVWFSVYQLKYFAFRKFLKYRRNRISAVEYGVPEGDMDYEYQNGCQIPPNERPPISQVEFEDSLYPCATPCFYWFWPWHDCIGSLTEHRFYERTPKKKSTWALDSIGASEAWGLESVYETSLPHVIAYHLVLVASTFAFWGWWQAKFPHDVQGAAVPLTVVLALLSIFWTSAGLLKFPENETFQQPSPFNAQDGVTHAMALPVLSGSSGSP